MSSIVKPKPMSFNFVGSIPLPDSATTFKRLAACFSEPGMLKRIPDGEPGERYYFVKWQSVVFSDAGVPHVMMNTLDPVDGWRSFTREGVRETMDNFPELDTKYDSEAIESYEIFRDRRDQGEIPQGVKFQFCIPTPDNFNSANIQPDFQAAIAPKYLDALIRSVRTTQDNIPHRDLAIQFDVAMEMALLHGVWYDFFKGPVTYLPLQQGKDALMSIFVEKIVRMANKVDEDVELGFHFCYGDAGGSHFIEPPDTAMIAELAVNIISKLNRTLDWIHFPVPKDRLDEAYLMPLKDRLVPHLSPRTEVYVGLVHSDDLSGTQKRLAVARKVLGNDIGISTECGLGRKNVGWLDSVLEIGKTLVKASS